MSDTTLLRCSVSWEEDYRDRLNPELLTELLQQSVPVLKVTDWKVTNVALGYAETLLPLSPATTNQHRTHQAALISLSADYTGGVAMATMLRGVPIAGIHKASTSESASVWLASMKVRYMVPSTGHLIGRCRIPETEQQTILSRYSDGKRVFVTLPVEFESNGQIVAQADMTYFAQPAIALLESGTTSSTLFNQKVKASARLIAGARARSTDPGGGHPSRVNASMARSAAGPQGEMLADKFNHALPQLIKIVQVRTQHGDQLIRSVKGLRQVVLAGAGLDMRPFQLKEEIPNAVFFEVELPEMLAERERVSQLIAESKFSKRVPVPCDFLKDDIEAELLNRGFDPGLPTAILYEGCSMYFQPAINRKMLRSFGGLMRHPRSRLWVDFVAESIISGHTVIPEVQAFFRKMNEIGEPFVFGTDHAAGFMADCGLEPVSTTTVREFIRANGEAADDPVLDQYSFNVAKSRTGPGAPEPDGLQFSFEKFASQPFFRQVNAQLVSRAGVEPRATVIDLACGPGAVTELILARMGTPPQGRVFAVDPSQRALDQAKKRVRSDIVRFVSGAAERLGSCVPAAHTILFCNAIHLIQEKGQVLAEAARVLLPGGVLAFNTTFFEGCLVGGTQRFYQLWMLRTKRWLQERRQTSSRGAKPTALQWLSADAYSSLLVAAGFENIETEKVECHFSPEAWDAICEFSTFIEGALPGVALELGCEALKVGVRAALQELGLRSVPRYWLQVIARRARP